MLNIYELPINKVEFVNMTRDHKQSALAILKTFREWVANPDTQTLTIMTSLGEKSYFSLTSGLCGNIAYLQRSKATSYRIELSAIFQSWPKYSGDLRYPVPSPYKSLCSRSVYYDLSTNPYSMYDQSHEYSKSRLELLDYLIGQIEKDFNRYVHVI